MSRLRVIDLEELINQKLSYESDIDLLEETGEQGTEAWLIIKGKIGVIEWVISLLSSTKEELRKVWESGRVYQCQIDDEDPAEDFDQYFNENIK